MGFPSLELRVQEVLKHDPLICVEFVYVEVDLQSILDWRRGIRHCGTQRV